MAKSTTTPLEQTSRLLDLVPFLLSHQGIALSELAQHFNVSNDVMLDDLNTLWMCGLPGYTPLELIDLNFDSGFVTIRNAAPLAYIRTMSSSEIVALALGLDLLRDGSLKLGADLSVRIDALSNKLRQEIDANISIASTPSTAHRSVISTSIATRVSVEMIYYSTSSDQETTRIVTAYDFYNENNVEYFRGHCHTSKGMRTFRLDRIVEVSMTEKSEEFSASSSGQTERIRVGAIVRTLDRATAEAFSLAYSDLRVGGSVSLEAFSHEWLIRSIMAGAGSLSIEEPQEIQALFSQSIDATLALYE
jgi:proteasome accessory factor C